MARSYWLVKQEPTFYPFAQLQKDKKTAWTGVRNHQARNHLAAMKKGDRVLRWVDGRRQVAAVRSVSAPVEEAYVFNLILGDPRAFVAADFVVRSKPPEEVRP